MIPGALFSQALAKDKLYPYIFFFAKGYGANQDPFRGYVIVFIVAEACVLIGEWRKGSGESRGRREFGKTGNHVSWSGKRCIS